MTTDITILLDRSGSMQLVQAPMQKALNAYVEEHRSLEGITFNLIQFDGGNDHDVVLRGVPISAVGPIRINPRGNTPLIDAFCKAIDSTGSRYSEMPPEDRPERVLFVVITDGQENSSKTFKRSDVSKRVHTQSDTYKWQFVYLGANQDTFAEAQSYGIAWGNTLKWSPNEENIGGLSRNLIMNTMGYTSGAMPMAAPFSGEQRIETATAADIAIDSNDDKDDILQRLSAYKKAKKSPTRTT